MSDESNNLGFAVSAVSISKSMFLTAATTIPPTKIGNVGVYKMQLATYTMGARNPVKVLKELGDFKC